MDSNGGGGEQELKHFGFLKEVVVKLLLLLSNVFDFVKENAGVLKTTIDSVETTLVSVAKPVFEKLKDLLQRILVFVDDKFDKYSPGLVKNLVAKVKSLIDKLLPLLEKLVTTIVSVLKRILAPILSLLQKLKSSPLVEKSQTLLQKGLDTTQSFLKSAPLLGHAQSLLKDTIDTSKSIVDDLPLKDTVNQALDTTKSIVGGLPLIGDKAQSLITDPTEIGNQAKSVVGGIGNITQSLFTNPADLANQALDSTKSVVGSIPVVGDAAQSIITNPKDLANQLIENNPVLGAVNSAAQNIIKEAQAAGAKAALKSAYLAFKVVAIPAIAQFWYKANTYKLFRVVAQVILPVIEYLAEGYNKLVNYLDGKGYSVADYMPLLPIEEMKTAYKVVKASMDSLSAVGDLTGINNN